MRMHTQVEFQNINGYREGGHFDPTYFLRRKRNKQKKS